MPIGVATILTTLTLAGSLHGAYSHVWPKRRGAKQGSAEVGHRRPPGCIESSHERCKPGAHNQAVTSK